MSVQLKNCPFCGGKSISRGRTGHSSWVECDSCGAQTAFTETVVEAIEKWNTRFLTGDDLREMHSAEISNLQAEIESIKAKGSPA